MKPLSKILLAGAIFGLLFSQGCTSVKRMEADEQVDVSGNWNDVDAQAVAEEMIKDSLNRPWLSSFLAKENRKPVVVVGTVSNNTAEHINTQPMTKSLERAYVNCGNIRVAADPSQRGELRNEVAGMRGRVTAESLKELRKETGADYYLLGYVNDIEDRQGGTAVRFYQVNLELLDLQSQEKVWIGEKRIKKVVKKSRFGI